MTPLALALALAMALGPLAALAPAQSPPDSPPTVVELRPASQPRPALKYRLVPERRNLVPGNAALFYHRAIQMLIQRRVRVASQANAESAKQSASVDDSIARWASDPLDKVPREEMRTQLASFRSILHETELGAKRTTCNWEFDLRDEGISMLLPEVQEMRSLARLVAVQARLEILDGKTDQAMHWIQVGLVMGRHVSQGPTLIQALVGMAIDSVMTRCLTDLIQAPGTPSLFWALADRPRPFVDMRQPLEGERYLLERELSELSELDRGPWSVHEARQFTSELESKLFRLATGEPIPGTHAAVPDMPSFARRLGIAAMAAKIYPEARRALIAEGRPEAEVEAMPVVQAAALYTIQEYARLRDESYKWMTVPYWQAFNRIDQANKLDVEDKFANPLLTMFRLLTPALNASRLAALRVERHFDALQCIEAIRIYAAAHAGKLPQSLDELIDTPVPRDPATGQPFVYRVDGDRATLKAPAPPGGPNHPSYAIDYLLKPAK